jgi:hypothetical protein
MLAPYCKAGSDDDNLQSRNEVVGHKHNKAQDNYEYYRAYDFAARQNKNRCSGKQKHRKPIRRKKFSYLFRKITPIHCINQSKKL